MKKTIILIIMLLTLAISVNASLYDYISSMGGKGCNLQKNGVSFSTSDLTNKFGLTGTGDCTFILDYYSFTTEVTDLMYFYIPSVWTDDFLPTYGEIDYVIGEGHEYLLLLGSDSSSLENIVDMVVNYDNYYNTLDKSDNVGVYLDMPSDDTPSDDSCVDEIGNNIFTGNSGTRMFFEHLVNFDSRCIEDNKLYYPYCGSFQFFHHKFSPGLQARYGQRKMILRHTFHNCTFLYNPS